MRNIYSVMKKSAAAEINAATLELLELETGEQKDTDTGNVTSYVKVTCEVAKKSGVFSRCQFSAKVPNAPIKVAPEELESQDYFVTFTDLEISFIDAKGTVYFRASDYSVDTEIEL